MLEEKVTQLYGEYQALAKSEKIMKKENNIFVKDATNIMSVFEELDL